MPIWFIFSLLSVLALAGAEISQKASLTQKVNISAITNNFYVWTLQGITGLTLAVILGQFSLNLSSQSLIKLAIIGIVYFIGGTAFYTSYKGNSPSISLTLGTISVIVSSIFGTLFLNDSFTITKVLGIGLILSSIFFINFDKKEKFNKYNLYALLGGSCFGIAFTIDKSFVVGMSPFMYLGLMCLTVAIVNLIFGLKLIAKETKELSSKNFIPMILSNSFFSTFNLLTFFAYANGANVGVADAINNSAIFFVILLEIIVLKDRTNLSKKLIAALIAISGVWILGLL